MRSTHLENTASHQAPHPTLPIAPWERYMALDFGPDYSMTCHQRFWFHGTPDRSQWINALSKVAEIHPFLSLEWTSSQWRMVPFDPSLQIDWQASAAPIAWTHGKPHENRIKFIIRTGKLKDLEHHDPSIGDEAGTLVIVKYPHAITDGMGVLAILEELQRILDQGQGSKNNPKDLAYRMHLGLNGWQRFTRLRWDMQRIAKYFLALPNAFLPQATPSTSAKSTSAKSTSVQSVPAKPTSSRSSSSTPDFCLERRVSTHDWMHRIRDAAHHRQVQVNDWLIAALFRTLAANHAQGTLRMSIPISMRPASNHSVCNLVSMVFLDRHPRQIAMPDLLESVAQEMQVIKQRDLGHAMLSFLGWATMGRGFFMRLFLKHFNMNVTTVLTNLGQPYREQPEFRIGSCQLLSLDTVPPLRPGTNLVVSVNRFGGQLAVTIRYNPLNVEPNLAKKIMDRFFAECESMIKE